MTGRMSRVAKTSPSPFPTPSGLYDENVTWTAMHSESTVGTAGDRDLGTHPYYFGDVVLQHFLMLEHDLSQLHTRCQPTLSLETRTMMAIRSPGGSTAPSRKEIRHSYQRSPQDSTSETCLRDLELRKQGGSTLDKPHHSCRRHPPQHQAVCRRATFSP